MKAHLSAKSWLFIFLALLTAVRLVLAASYELSPDEAYYFQWAQHPALSYFSKGPGVAMAIRASTAIFGANEFGVRFFSPLLALGTSLILFGFARRLYGESAGIWIALTMNFIPIFNVGALVMTIDPLSIFFWAAALWTFWIALEKSPHFSRWWPLTGLLIGLGFLSKYTNAMQLLSIVLVLATTRKFRREFKRPGFYAMLFVFAICTIPVIIWNSQHAWITLTHLRNRGSLDSPFAIHPSEFGKFLGAQLGVFSPLIFVGMFAALWWSRPLAIRHFKPRFLVLFAVPLLAMYFVLALKKAGEPNWTAPAFLSLGILSAALWQENATSARASFWKKRFAFAALALGVLMSVLVLDTDFVRLAGFRWDYRKDPSGRLRGWKTSALAVSDVRKKFENETGKPVFLIANKYQTAASIGFYLPEKNSASDVAAMAGLRGHPPVYIPESQNIENQFSFFPRYDEMEDLRQLARDFLNSPDSANATNGGQSELRDSLKEALAAMPEEVDQNNERAATEARRKLAETLHAANPALPIDESFTSEGVNFFIGKNALYITDDPRENDPPTSLQRGFERVEMIARLQITRRGLPLRELRVFACYNYRSVSL